MIKNKISIAITIVIGVFLLIASTGLYHYRTINNMKERYEDRITIEKSEKLKAIDSIKVLAEQFHQEILNVQTEKEFYVEKFKVLQRKLQDYSQPRYYPDATFLSESKRIATSSYRHNQPNDTTGQGQNH